MRCGGDAVTKRACDLKPGMEVLRPRAASADAWLTLADPALEWVGGGSWVLLLYTDGTKSNRLDPGHSVEVRPASQGPAS
jgi:hypothetical protein